MWRYSAIMKCGITLLSDAANIFCFQAHSVLAYRSFGPAKFCYMVTVPTSDPIRFKNFYFCIVFT
jgi:hypothetical protein